MVSHGKGTDPPGPIFPELRAELSDGEIVARDGSFDSLAFPEIRRRVEAAGRQNLVLTGLMTEGCVPRSADSPP